MASLVAESLFFVAGASCAVAQAAIVRGIIVEGGPSGAPPASEAESDHPRVAHRAHTGREAAWALLPGVAVALVLIWTWHTMHPAHQAPHPADAPTILAPSTGT